MAKVAALLGVGWATVMRAVEEYGTPLVADPARLEGVSGVGVDETAFLAATATRRTQYVTGIVEVTPGRPARLLDVVAGRTGRVYTDWIAEREQVWREQIRFAALDPFRGYASALRVELPDALRVLDAFHVVKLGFDAVDQVRRRVQHDTPSDTARATLRAGLDRGDPDGEVTAAWLIAQQLRDVDRAPDAAPAGTGPWPSNGPPPAARYPRSPASAAPCVPGAPSGWPTSTPPEPPTDPPRQSTC